MMSNPVQVTYDDGRIARVRLCRPEVRNAMDAATVAGLSEAFRRCGEDPALRAVVLEGEGRFFCGGADITTMRDSLALSEEENLRDALALSDMFGAIESCPVPVVAAVRGAALGGGAGLVACADVGLAEEDAIFGFTEVKLGIVPAVISPFVIRKIGAGHARALFPTGERFAAERALRIGLIHQIAPPGQLEALVAATLRELCSAGPQAVRVAKQIARTVPSLPPEEARAWTAARIARQRVSPEGQEGLRAFLEKRRPAWSS
jgi:methylglutaconyl-CoA hydratase